MKTEKIKNKRKLKLILSIGLPLILVVGLFFPLPYYIEQPGGAIPVNQMVNVVGKKDEHKGNFYLTTVEMVRGSAASILYSKFDPFADVLSSKEMTGGLTNQQFDLVNQFYMQTAQNTAVYQAFKLAGKPYKMEYQGVYVLNISEDSTFKNELQLSDTVTEINGKTFKSSAEMIKYVSQQKVGDSVTIKYTRIDGSRHESTGRYIKLSNGKTGIGIGLVDHTQVVTDPKVKIDAGAIGGPSAGMMFTLEIYGQLTGKDLRQGREVAGTGTINEDGSIGQIGGVDKKVATASKEGAKIFLCPDETEEQSKASGTSNNYTDALAAAKKLKTDMKIVPVKTIQEALDYLEK
jgi:PDZ domain-containing protein